MKKTIDIQIGSKYGIDENRKTEIEEKEWCGDIYAVIGGEKFEFEFISMRRLCQEIEFNMSNSGYSIVDSNTVLPQISYDMIVKAIEKMAEEGRLPHPSPVAD